MKYAIFYKSRGEWIGPWGKSFNSIVDAAVASIECKLKTKSKVQIRTIKWKKISKKKLRKAAQEVYHKSIGKVDVYCC